MLCYFIKGTTVYAVLLYGSDHSVCCVSLWEGPLYMLCYFMGGTTVYAVLFYGRDHCICCVSLWEGPLYMLLLFLFVQFYNFSLLCGLLQDDGSSVVSLAPATANRGVPPELANYIMLEYSFKHFRRYG